MQDNTVPDETIELPVTEHDEADIIKMFGSEAEQPEHRTILEVWREVLAPADTERNSKVAPQWAINMVTAHVGVTFADLNNFRDEYFDKIIVLFNILLEEIATDDECLLRNSVQDDLIFNGQHYKNLLTNWQLQFMRWEMEWDVVAPGAAVTIGVLAEVHKMFFGQMGLVPHLSSINFDEAYTEADQLALTEALQALKEGSSE